VQRALGDSDALGLAGRRLSELSGGERQRVLLARALATEAPLLLLDEPEAHLDPPHQRRLVELLRRLAGQGNTVVSVMHDLNLALAADRLWLMQGGRLMLDAATGSPALAAAMGAVFDGAVELLAHPARPGGRLLAVPAWNDETRS
jgi:iron complex transport system ATP-binding protein